MNPIARVAVGVGGALLLASLFMSWTDDNGVSGWELLPVTDVFLLIVAVVAVLAAVTGGNIGLFRPDVSLIGAADVLGVISSVLIAWLILFDFPEGSGVGYGAYVALIAAVAVAGGAGDYRVLRGAPVFPRIGADRTAGRPSD